MQHDVLAKYPKANVRVYAVWFNMYPGDARQRWPGTLLTDARVRHFWDGKRAVGQLYLQMLPAMWPKRSAETVLPDTDALWDAWMLYPRDALWNEQPADVVSWGSPILRTNEALLRTLEQIEGPSPIGVGRGAGRHESRVKYPLASSASTSARATCWRGCAPENRYSCLVAGPRTMIAGFAM